MNRILLACLLAATISFAGCNSKGNSQTGKQPDENTAVAESKADSSDAAPSNAAPVGSNVDENTPEVSSKDAEEEYPRFTRKSSHIPTGSRGIVTIGAKTFDVIETNVRQVDWSSKTDELLSVSLELDSRNSLAITQVEGAEGADDRPMVATWKRAGEMKRDTTPILSRISNPLKDVDHAVSLLRAYHAGEDIEPLAEWVKP